MEYIKSFIDIARGVIAKIEVRWKLFVRGVGVGGSSYLKRLERDQIRVRNV